MDIKYKTYQDSSQLDPMIEMIKSELSEPYSIFTYRYFLTGWPKLTIFAYVQEQIIGVIIGKIDLHRESQRAYIAMLEIRDRQVYVVIRVLVEKFIDEVKTQNVNEIVLETESVNKGALSLYTRFAKDKRLFNYYMNGNDAFRLKLWVSEPLIQVQEQINQA